jgi:hypothetical protein
LALTQRDRYQRCSFIASHQRMRQQSNGLFEISAVAPDVIDRLLQF